MKKKQTKKKKPKTVELVRSDYQPTKAEKEEEFAPRSRQSP